MATTTTIELNTDYQSAERFPAWMALSVFSAVCLAAFNSQQNPNDRTSADKWVLSATILSMCFSFFACLAYLAVRHLFVATIPEICFSFLILVFWGTSLPVLMNPTNGIAVQGDTVQNANLYFFSWVALGVAVYIAGSLLQETTGIEIKKSALTHGKTGKWYGFAASSIVVMVASVRVYEAAQCGGLLKGQPYCKRTNLGIALGCISFVSGVGIACGMAKQLVQSFVELLVSALLLTMWCFGVGFITFGTSPGARIGNLYFSTWISFIVIVVIFAAVFRDFMAARSAAAAEHHGGGGDEEVAENGSGVPAVPDEEDI